MEASHAPPQRSAAQHPIGSVSDAVTSTIQGGNDTNLAKQSLHLMPHVAALQDATNVLCPGPLLNQMEQRLGVLAQGTDATHIENITRAAERDLAKIPCDVQRRLLLKFLETKAAGVESWPTLHYDRVPVALSVTLTEPELRYLAMCRSLLSTGLLPPAEVHDEISLNRVILEEGNGSADSQTNKLCSAVLSGAVAVATVAPEWAAWPVVASGLVACGTYMRRLNPRYELIAGMIAENRDAFETILSGEVADLKQTLRALFEGQPPEKRELQREGFLVARMLRVLGVDPTVVCTLFDKSSLATAEQHPLNNRLHTELQKQGHWRRERLIDTLAKEGRSPSLDSVTTLLETMNKAHFVWAIHEKGIVRSYFAATVLAAACGDQRK